MNAYERVLLVSTIIAVILLIVAAAVADMTEEVVRNYQENIPRPYWAKVTLRILVVVGILFAVPITFEGLHWVREAIRLFWIWFIGN